MFDVAQTAGALCETSRERVPDRSPNPRMSPSEPAFRCGGVAMVSSGSRDQRVQRAGGRVITDLASRQRCAHDRHWGHALRAGVGLTTRLETTADDHSACRARGSGRSWPLTGRPRRSHWVLRRTLSNRAFPSRAPSIRRNLCFADKIGAPRHRRGAAAWARSRAACDRRHISPGRPSRRRSSFADQWHTRSECGLMRPGDPAARMPTAPCTPRRDLLRQNYRVPGSPSPAP
jgi:hypothetical protein